MKSTACALVCLLFACGSHSIKFAGDDVPHILHKLAPANETFWPDAWNICLKSWKRIYPGWELKVWNDQDIDNLVKNDYPQQYGWFKALPHQILRVDAARSFVLHKFGGIYSDMDVYAYKPLELPKTGQAILLGSHAGRDEMVQNSLMASPAKHKFWENTFLQMKAFFEKYPKPWTKAVWVDGFSDYVVEGTGPNMLKHAIQERHLENLVTILPPEKYMGGDQCTPKTCFTRHAYTGCWAPGSSCAAHTGTAATGGRGGDLTEELALNDGKQVSMIQQEIFKLDAEQNSMVQEMFKLGYK